MSKQKIKVKMLHFDNPFEDYTPENAKHLLDDNQVKPNSKLALAIEQKWKEYNAKFRSVEYGDYSVYTGTSGIALLKLKRAPDDLENLKDVKTLLCLSYLKNKRHTFLCGDAGPLAIGAVVCYKLNEKQEMERLLENLIRLKKDALDPDSDLASEYLYGRGGYLYALLFVNEHIQPEPIEKGLIRNVISAILTVGTRYAAAGKFPCPLMYEWHDSLYLGAAHGVSGIMYMLLHLASYLSDSELQNLVKPTVDYLASLRFPSGNYPSSLGRDVDSKVQWCHGAPGFVFLYTMAYKVYKEQKYLKLALEAGEVVWQRGLLRKGYSICHGVAGNAYCFLDLYQTTKDVKHLYRAVKFAEWVVDYTREHEEHYPDRPLSLFEGIAGRMYFLLDMLRPMEAKFPGFCL